MFLQEKIITQKIINFISKIPIEKIAIINFH